MAENAIFTTNMVIAIIIHFLVIVLTIVGYLHNLKRNPGRFNLFLLITIFFSVFYGLIPILYILEYDNLYSYSFYIPTHIRISTPYKDPVITAALLSLIAYIVILFIYFYGRVFFKASCTKQYTVDSNKIIRLAFFLLLISVPAILLYSQSMGGIVPAIIKAELFRARNAETSSYTLLRYIMPFIEFSALVFFSTYIEIRKKKHFFYFLISFCFSILFLLLNAGRSGIVVFFAMFLLILLDWKRKFNLIKLLPLGGLVIILAVYGDPFFTYLATGKFSHTTDLYSVYLRLIRELSPAYVNTLKVASYSTEKGTLYFFSDIFISTIKILPGKIENLFGSNLKGMTEIHTENFSPPPGTGIIVDMITYGYYQLALPGVVIISTIFALIIRKLDDFLLAGNTILFSTLLPWTAFFIMGCMTSLEINTIILTRGVYWIPLFLFIFYSKKNITYNPSDR